MNPLLPPVAVGLLVGALALVGAVLAWRSAVACGRAARTGITAARFFAVAALAIPFLNPGRWIVPPVEGDSEWAVLVDTSASMATTDAAGGRSRFAEARAVADRFRDSVREETVALYGFSDVLRPLDEALTVPDGASTDLAAAITGAVDRYRAGSPLLRGIVLLSDGRQIADTPLEPALARARAFAVPVFPVVLGGPVVIPDVEIVAARRQITAFKGQALAPVARVTNRGAGQRRQTVRLEDAGGRSVAEQVIDVTEGETATVRFDLAPLDAGYHRYRFRVDGWPEERDPTNNEAAFAVHVTERVVRVLLVEGSPYWDTKFIAQLLQRDRNFRFEVVYRLTGERFFTVAAAGASGGADSAPAPVERTVFPDSAEALAAYDLIVFGHSVEYFLDDAKIALLRDWVENRGGALVFARGRPVTTALPALEPLYPTDWDVPWRSPFRWEPTFAGMDTGLFGAELPGAGDAVWAKLPPLTSADYGANPRPFSQVLAEGVATTNDRAARFPVVVSRRVGEGLTVAVNSDDLWRWDFFPKFAGAEDIYRTFWPQLFNWTLAYSDFLPGRNFALKLSRQSAAVGRPLRARVLRRPGTEPNAAPLLRVRQGDELLAEVDPTATAEGGAWESLLTFDRPGLTQIELWRSAEDGEPVLSSSIAVIGPATESTELSADPDLLARLARETGGRVLRPDAVAEAVRPFERPASPDENGAQWRSDWDQPLWLVPLLGFFALEWFLRRRAGLI